MASQRPWVVRKANQTRLWAWMPFGDGNNRIWLKSELGRIQPEWNEPEQRWEIARKHLWVLTEALAEKFGEVELTLEFSREVQHQLPERHQRCQRLRVFLPGRIPRRPR
ncbi:hypothetical protein ACFXO9_31555 [Nocardia tengchongensis]|uniref:hypothetical protein n=1 Tax=Nocardia tengchongensis TaxID=2055889 RepID=UPI003686D780